MIFWKTLEAVAVFIALGLVGFMLLARKAIAKEALSTLSFLSLDLAVPALVFHDMMVLFNPVAMPYWWVSPLVWLGSFVVLVILARVSVLFFPAESRKEVFVSLVYPNAIFIPLILLPALFPERNEITVELFLFTMLFSFFLFQGFGLFYGSRRKIIFQWKKLFPPLVVILIVSLVIQYAGLQPWVPGIAIDVARRLGALSVPLLLFVLGGNVYIDREVSHKQSFSVVLAFVVVKNILFPLVHLFLVFWLPVSATLKFLVFLQSALPPVTALPVLVEREGGNRSLVQALFLWSVVALVVTLPVWVWVYESIYGL